MSGKSFLHNQMWKALKKKQQQKKAQHSLLLIYEAISLFPFCKTTHTHQQFFNSPSLSLCRGPEFDLEYCA